MRVLLAEDDPDIQATLTGLLEAEGFTVDACSDGQETMTFGLKHDYHAVILDPGLPIWSGEEIVRRWRKEGRRFPIIVVTGTRNTREQIRELIRLGISHHAAKPIPDYGILIDWVRSFSLSVQGVSTGAVLHHGNIEIDTETETVRYKGRRVLLSRREFLVIRELALAAGAPMTARALASKCLADDEGAKEQDVQIYIQRIRNKFGAPVIANAGGGRGYELA